MRTYADFLAAKRATATETGPTAGISDVHPLLHPWQAEIVAWAVRVGRAAVWADTGLGKTLMQVEWARLSGGTALIVAPLAVCQQTVREAAKVGVTATYVRSGDAITGKGLWVTNYEMVEHFDATALDAVVLDEASILKQSDGKTRTRLIRHFADVPARLACTATPAPNDIEELTNQAEFLGRSTRVNMLAAYFVHDDEGWRLKGHARQPMFRWMTSWAVALRHPSDMGYPDDGYILPGLEIVPHLLPIDVVPEGQLFATDIGGVGGRAEVRRQTLEKRCDLVIELVNESHGWSSVESWHGSLSTPKPGGSDTSQIPQSVSGERRRGGRQSRIANTCAPTTRQTANGSSSTSAKRASAGTLGAESGMRATLSSEPSASDSQSLATPKPSATAGSGARSGSRRPSTTPSSQASAEDAPSAGRTSATAAGTGSTSTTTTTRAKSEASSAHPATSASESSSTTPTSCDGPPTTSLEPWVLWCGLNDEQEYLRRAFGDRAFSLTGRQSPEEKVDILYRWLAGERPILLTKPSIAGMGINMQHCARMAFVGLSDSYEAYYQAIRRCYRYGQERVVHAHIVLSELEGQIAANVARKEREASHIAEGMVAEMRAAGELGRTT